MSAAQQLWPWGAWQLGQTLIDSGCFASIETLYLNDIRVLFFKVDKFLGDGDEILHLFRELIVFRPRSIFEVFFGGRVRFFLKMRCA